MATRVTQVIPYGANIPQRLDLTFTSTDIDLTTVTSVVWNVQPPGGVAATTWSASIVSATATVLVTRHTFAAADTTTPGIGEYVIEVTMTTASGAFPNPPIVLTVAGTYKYAGYQ